MYLGYFLMQEEAANIPYRAWIWIGACLTGAMANQACSVFLNRAYSAGLIERGIAAHRDCAFTLNEQGITVRCGEDLNQMSWRMVSEIGLERDHWLLVGVTSWFLPRRFFVDPEAERAFLELALRNLPRKALDRSQSAQDVYNRSLPPWKGYGEP